MITSRCNNENGCFYVVNRSELIKIVVGSFISYNDETKIEVFNTLEEVKEVYPDIEYENPLND